jgi:hypothetical protein
VDGWDWYGDGSVCANNTFYIVLETPESAHYFYDRGSLQANGSDLVGGAVTVLDLREKLVRLRLSLSLHLPLSLCLSLSVDIFDIVLETPESAHYFYDLQANGSDLVGGAVTVLDVREKLVSFAVT